MLQGMTAHYLSTDVFPLGPGHPVPGPRRAGGVGLLLIQMAKLLAREVFTTVGSPEKAETAAVGGRRSRPQATMVVHHGDFATRSNISRAATSGRRLRGVGRATFTRGLSLHRPRGHMVTFGNASGPVVPSPRWR
jgi:NADPH2:quinone reductase